MGLKKSSFDGLSPAVLDISPDFLNNQITIEGLTTGSALFEVLAADTPSDGEFQPVKDGSVDLSEGFTFNLLGFQLQKIRVTVTPAAAFDLIVRQTKRP